MLVEEDMPDVLVVWVVKVLVMVVALVLALLDVLVVVQRFLRVLEEAEQDVLRFGCLLEVSKLELGCLEQELGSLWEHSQYSLAKVGWKDIHM